jgi:hypothetical protein
LTADETWLDIRQNPGIFLPSEVTRTTLGSFVFHSQVVMRPKREADHSSVLATGLRKFSIKHPTIYTINLIFIALSRRHRSTCFGQRCAHHQEPPSAAFAASGYHLIAGLDVFQAMVGLLVNRGYKVSWRGLLMMGTALPETC